MPDSKAKQQRSKKAEQEDFNARRGEEDGETSCLGFSGAALLIGGIVIVIILIISQ